MQVHNITDKQEAKEKGLGEAPGEVIAAISMALHEHQGADHDVEETILTISRVKQAIHRGARRFIRCVKLPIRNNPLKTEKNHERIQI